MNIEELNLFLTTSPTPVMVVTLVPPASAWIIWIKIWGGTARSATLLVTPFATAWILKSPDGESLPGVALTGAVYDPLTLPEGLVTLTVTAGLSLFGFVDRPQLNVGETEALLG